MSQIHQKWWLILGTFAFLAIFLRGAVSSFGVPITEVVYGLVDWLAASVIYFFYGAMIGHFIDWWRVHRKKQKVVHPWWFFFALAFWFIGSASAFIVVGVQEQVQFWLFLFFPMTFGIFLPAFAYDFIFPGLMLANEWWKIVFDVVFLGLFASWLLFLLKKKVVVQRVLLGVLFAILLLGMASCLSALA